MATAEEVDGDGCELKYHLHMTQIADTDRFIIDGVITLPIALYGFAIFPDVPRTTKAFYLSQEVGD